MKHSFSFSFVCFQQVFPQHIFPVMSSPCMSSLTTSINVFLSFSSQTSYFRYSLQHSPPPILSFTQTFPLAPISFHWSPLHCIPQPLQAIFNSLRPFNADHLRISQSMETVKSKLEKEWTQGRSSI